MTLPVTLFSVGGHESAARLALLRSWAGHARPQAEPLIYQEHSGNPALQMWINGRSQANWRW